MEKNLFYVCLRGMKKKEAAKNGPMLWKFLNFMGIWTSPSFVIHGLEENGLIVNNSEFEITRGKFSITEKGEDLINSLKFEEVVIEIKKDYEDFNKENFIHFLNM
jgi:hypothetical protein